MSAPRQWFAEFGPPLERMGYEPLPIIPGLKRPPFYGWQEPRPVESLLPAFRGYSVGLLTQLNPALDIDVTNAALAEDIQRLVDRLLGEAPIRFGQRPKRVALYQRAGDPFPKLTLGWRLDDVSHKVEVLSDGQQVVTHGPHPSGSIYTWQRSPDLSIPRRWLPRLDGATTIRFFRTLAGVLPRLDCVELRATGWDLGPAGAGYNFNVAPRTYQHTGDDPPPWRRYSAREIAQRLDPKAHTEGGAGKWRCRCPVHHGESNNSLSIEEIGGTVVWHCFGGCTQDGVARAGRVRGMTYQHKAFAEAEAAWNSGTDPASLLAAAILPAYFGEEGPSREIVISEQRSFIEGWLASTHQSAIVMREIAERRAEAFAAEGLT